MVYCNMVLMLLAPIPCICALHVKPSYKPILFYTCISSHKRISSYKPILRWGGSRGMPTCTVMLQTVHELLIYSITCTVCLCQ